MRTVFKDEAGETFAVADTPEGPGPGYVSISVNLPESGTHKFEVHHRLDENPAPAVLRTLLVLETWGLPEEDLTRIDTLKGILNGN